MVYHENLESLRPLKTNLLVKSIVHDNKDETGEQMAEGEQARGNRQRGDVCVRWADRKKDRYGESVTVSKAK